MDEKYVYEKEIRISHILSMLCKKSKRIILWGVITAVIVICSGCILSGSSIIKDNKITYEPREDYYGTAKIFLGEKPATSTIAKLYLSGNEMYNNLVRQLSLDLSYNELFSMVSLQNSTDSVIIVNVSGTDQNLVHEITDYLSIYGSKNLKDKLSNNDIAIIEPAYTVERQYSIEVSKEFTSYKKLVVELLKYLLVGFLIGTSILCIIYTVLYILDNTIKSEKDVVGYLGIQVLGNISIINGTDKSIINNNKIKKNRLSQYTLR